MLRSVKTTSLAQPGGGLVTFTNLFALQSGQTPNCMDVKFGVGGVIEKRLGATTLNAIAVVNSLATGFAPDAGPSLTTSLQIFWNLDDESGSRLAAFGGASLTDNNTVTSTAGVVNNAALFVAANSESLSLANTSQVLTGDIDFTVAAWVRFSTTMGSAEERVILAKRDDNRLRINLNGYWKLENTGWIDASGNGNTLTATAGSVPTITAGRVNSGAQFVAASNQSLSIADNASLSTGDIDFTVGAWVYPDTLPALGGIVSKFAAAGGNREYNLSYRGGADDFCEFYIYNGAGASNNVNSATAPLLAGSWNLVMGWHDAANNTINIQVGTAAVVSSGTSIQPQDSTASLFLGHRGDPGTHWNGRMDEAFFYKRLLTAGERTELFNSGRGRTHPFIEVGSSANEYLLYASSGQGATRFSFGVSSSNALMDGAVVANSFGAVTTGTWYHVVGWHDAANNRLGISVNLSVNTASYTSGIRAGSADFQLGAIGVNTGPFWDGAIDATGKWNKVLTAQERSDLYNAGAGNQYNQSLSNAGWGMFDFGAGFSGGDPLRWLVVAAGTGILASSNRGVTFVTIATDRGAEVQYFERSKSFLICTSETMNKVLYWAGSTGTFSAALAIQSAPPAKHALDYAGFLLLMNDSGGKRRVTYADNTKLLTDPWTTTFELPSDLDDEITGGVVLNKNAYVFTKHRTFRVSHVGGNPDFLVQQVKGWGAVPRTIKKATLPEVGEVIVSLGWDRKLRIFDGSDDRVISDPIEQDNGICPFSLSKIHLPAIGRSFAEVDDLEQTYKLWLALTPSTQPNYMLGLNLRTLAFYPYQNQNYNMAVMADSAFHRNLFAVNRAGFIHWADTTNRDVTVAVDEYYDSPFLFGSKGPKTVSKAQKVDLYFSPTSSANLYVYERRDFDSSLRLRDDLISFSTTGTVVQIRKSLDVPGTQNVYGFRLTSSASTTDPWKMTRIDYHFSEMGIGEG